MKRMINTYGAVALGCVLITACTGYAQKIDLLKPEVQAKELAVRRFIESFGDTTIPYKVTKQKYKESVGKMPGNPLKNFDGYVVAFPKDIQARLGLLDKKVLYDTLMDYFDDERLSFTVAVLMMAEATLYRPGHDERRRGTGGMPEVQALLKADKTLWNKDFVPNPLMDDYTFVMRREIFLVACYWSLAVDYNNPLHNTLIAPSYRYSVLMQSIPAVYAGKLFRAEDALVFRADWSTPSHRQMGDERNGV